MDLENKYLYTNINLDPELAKPGRESRRECYLKQCDRINSNLALEERMGEDIYEKIDFVKAKITEYFTELGIAEDRVNFTPIFLLGKNTQDSEDNSFATSNPGHVALMDTDIEDQSLRQLVFLSTLIHEWYHSIAPEKLIMSFSKEGEISQDLDRHGMVFKSTLDDNTRHARRALEEGLAVNARNKFFYKLKSLFPQEAWKLFEKIEEKLSSLFNLRKGDFSFVKYYENNVRLTNTTSIYGKSLELVEFLEKEIPDFHRLVEKSRMLGLSRDLVRAIEVKFGKGYFRKIVSAEIIEEDVGKLLEELKEISGESKNIRKEVRLDLKDKA